MSGEAGGKQNQRERERRRISSRLSTGCRARPGARSHHPEVISQNQESDAQPAEPLATPPTQTSSLLCLLTLGLWTETHRYTHTHIGTHEMGGACGTTMAFISVPA